MSKTTLFRFVGVFTLIAILVCGATYAVFKKRLGLSRKGNRALLAFFIFTGLLMILCPFFLRGIRVDLTNPYQQSLQFLQYFLMGWVGVNFILFVAIEVVQLLFKPFDPKKRIFLTEGVARTLVAGTTLATVGGLVEAQAGPEVIPVEIKLRTLPEAFNGLTLAQISDVHIGPILQHSFLDKVVDQVMSLNADIIVITGDLVDGTVAQLSSQMEPLKRLKAREGIYFCTGNHEYYSGAEDWIQFLESIGIHVFKNSNVLLTRKGQAGEEKIALAGVYDFQGGKYSDGHITDPHAAFKTTEPVECSILLAHNPYSIDEAANAGFDLQISGHTHAGQFYPFAWLVKLHLKHFEGLYQINEKTQLYVNRGTAYWGPPNRLGKRSEITHFTLRRG